MKDKNHFRPSSGHDQLSCSRSPVKVHPKHGHARLNDSFEIDAIGTVKELNLSSPTAVYRYTINIFENYSCHVRLSFFFFGLNLKGKLSIVSFLFLR
jgi:hypothetical protein